jgi:hypothetical protein
MLMVSSFSGTAGALALPARARPGGVPRSAEVDASWDRAGRAMFGDAWAGMGNVAKPASATPQGTARPAAMKPGAAWTRVGRAMFGDRWGGA